MHARMVVTYTNQSNCCNVFCNGISVMELRILGRSSEILLLVSRIFTVCMFYIIKFEGDDYSDQGVLKSQRR
jgi:hypothetical protein